MDAIKKVFMAIGMFFTAIMLLGFLITLTKKPFAETSTNSALEPIKGSAPIGEDRKPLTDSEYKTLLKEYNLIESTFNCNVDKFQKAKFCRIRGTPNTYVGAYLAVSPLGKDRIPGCFARFDITYYDSDWVFFDNVRLLIDGNNHDYALRERPKRDNANGSVWEVYDVPVEDRELQILNSIATSKSTEVRLSGQRQKDFKVSANLKKGIKNILRAVELCQIDKK